MTQPCHLYSSPLELPLFSWGIFIKMSIRRADTRKVTRSNTTAKPKKITIDDVQQGIKIIYPPPGSEIVPDVDIVFVPGLGADPVRSWKSNTTEFNWTSDKDGLVRDFPKSRILLYQYESAWTGPLKVKQYISNLGMTLLHGLKTKREKCPRRPIVFIGHSMGGLVIAKAITLSDTRRELFPAMFPCIAGCIFFGTPFGGTAAATAGSYIALIGEKFDKAYQSKLLEMMKTGDESLRELKGDFVRLVTKLSQKIELFCFWEERPTDFAKLAGLPSFFKVPKEIEQFVTRDSATLTGVDDMGLACIHRDLVKFDGPKDERYQLVRNPLKTIIHGAQLVVKNRFNSTRNIDHNTIAEVMEVLEGAQILKKRKALATKYTASSWLSEAQEYRDWFSMAVRDGVLATPVEATPVELTASSGDCLWIRGPEGRGKTNNIIAALDEIDNVILADNDGGQAPTLLAYFFCEPATDYSTAEDLLKSLLWQLVRQQGLLAPYAKHFVKKKAKEDASKTVPQLTVENLWQVLQEMLLDEFIGGRVYFVINNLHVLPEESDSTITLMKLINAELMNMKLQNQKRVPIRWLFTSRDNDSVGQALKAPGVRLIDLEDEKYGTQVQLELRKHAYTKVRALSDEKKYNKAAAYFASSLIGKRAQNTQWIDITCVYLKEIPEDENELTVRHILQDMPQDLSLLLDRAWMQVFSSNTADVEKIQEMLRVLVLTYEDPTEPELGVLAGLYQKEEDKTALRQLVEKCKPLLVVKRTSPTEVRISFMNVVVKTHLLENASKLLGLSKEATEWHHGVLPLRSFSHLMEKLNYPEPEKELEYEEVDAGSDDGNGDGDNDGDDEEETREENGDEGDDEEEDSDVEDYDDGESEWSEDEDEEMDEEAERVKDVALAYMVKHWLHHASKATTEIAEDLSLEDEFWKSDSLIRRRWLVEYERLTKAFDEFDLDKNMTALHIAASVGFTNLVLALIRNGHQHELNVRDESFNTPLHFAASFGRVNIVEALLNKGAIIDDGMQDEEDKHDTPLHMAALSGNLAVMKKLLRWGADINAFSPSDVGTVVNCAIYSGNREAIKLLIERGASLSTVTSDDSEIEGPLALAAQLAEITMFDYLIEACADKLSAQEYDKALVAAAEAGRVEVFNKLLAYNHPQECFQAALEAAAGEDNWDIIMILLERCQELDCSEPFISAACDSENMDKVLEAIWRHTNGVMPEEVLDEALRDASGCGKLSTVDLLLEFGANPNSADEEEGTALTEACYLGDMTIVQLLLDKGADVNCADGWALQTSAAEGHDTIIEELLRRGADINACTTNENFPAGTALQAACEAGKLDIVELLLKHNANPDLGAGPQTCPLIAAATRGEDEIVELLVNAKADVNVFGGSEVGTPLTVGAAFLKKESLELLLKAGAGIDLKEADGDTALIAAARRGDKDCVQFLLEEGADIMISNNNGENAIQCAAANVDAEDVECLTILVNHVSAILSAIKTAMDSGNTAVTDVVRSVDMQKHTSDLSNNLRRGSDASFTANDEQIHFNTGEFPPSGLDRWGDNGEDVHSMKIPATTAEQFPQATEDLSIIPPLFQESPGEPYTYPERESAPAQFAETKFDSRPQDSSSSFTPYRPSQAEGPSTDMPPQLGQMKIKRKPSPGNPLAVQPVPVPLPRPSEYTTYQGGPPPLQTQQNVSSAPTRPPLPTQSTYPRANPPSQYRTTGSYQPPPWTSDQGPYPSNPPPQQQPQYQSPPQEQQPSQRPYAPYHPQGYPSQGSGSSFAPSPLQGGYRGDGYVEAMPGTESNSRPGIKEQRSSFFNIGFGKRGN